MLIEANACQLLIIDVQSRLQPAIHEAGASLARMIALAETAKELRIPITLTEHYPEGLGASVPELAAWSASPLIKTSFDACEQGLIEHLEQLGTLKPSANAKSIPKHLQKPPQNQRSQIVVAGWEAHVCVLQTAMSLLDEELDVFLVSDACSSRSERNRDAAYDRLAAEGANLVTTEMVLFEWLRSQEHALFAKVLETIKALDVQR